MRKIYNRYSVYKLRKLSQEANQGDISAQMELRQYNSQLARIANRRMTMLERHNMDYYAYDRAYSFVSSSGTYDTLDKQTRFATSMDMLGDYTNVVRNILEMETFINSKSSTIGGMREIQAHRIKEFADHGIKFDSADEADEFLRFIGTDEVQEILRSAGHSKIGSDYGSGDTVEKMYGQFIEDREKGTHVLENMVKNYNTFYKRGKKAGQRKLYYDQLIDKLDRNEERRTNAKNKNARYSKRK